MALEDGIFYHMVTRSAIFRISRRILRERLLGQWGVGAAEDMLLSKLETAMHGSERLCVVGYQDRLEQTCVLAFRTFHRRP